MTVQPAPDRGGSAPVTRPSLALVAACGECAGPTVTVRSRLGKPVRLDAGADGKAVIDPDGVWWLLKFRDQWRVAELQPGEDPPASGAGRRHREHQCPSQAEAVIRARFGSGDVREQQARFDATVVGDDGTAVTGLRRPAGRGRGLDGPVCRERVRYTQDAPGRAVQAMCVRCGRVTARRDSGDGMPWCGGNLPGV